LRLDAFHPDYRRFIRELTSCSTALEDLADSFPGLLFALASNYATPAQRERAFEMVYDGVALREVADVLDLPWWLRKLPPRAFAAPLPRFPVDADFTFRISNLIPSDEQLLPSWLTHVGHACEACGPSYALWVARQSDLTDPLSDMSRVMAAWAWFSQREGPAGTPPAAAAVDFEMSFKRARENAGGWRQRLRLIECLGPGIESPWLADGSGLDFQFVALRTVDDFITRAKHSTIASTSTPISSTPASPPCFRSARASVVSPASRSGCTRRRRPCRKSCSCVPRVTGVRLPRSGRRPMPGSAARRSSRCRPSAMCQSRYGVLRHAARWGPYLAPGRHAARAAVPPPDVEQTGRRGYAGAPRNAAQ
jgi:hypothetical protein